MHIRPLLLLALGALAAAACDAPTAPDAARAPNRPALAATTVTSSGGTCTQTTTGARRPAAWTPEALDRAAFLALAAKRGGVVSAADLGVRPGTGADVAVALQAAIDQAARSRAAVLLLPAGEYVLGGEVHLVSGLAIVGEGCGRTIVRRLASSTRSMLFRVDGVSGVRVQGIQFDLNHGPVFFRAIGFRGTDSREVVIVDNCFMDSNPNTSGDDRFAVELTAEKGNSWHVWIGGNRASDYMQLTAGGGAGIDVLRIVDNVVDHAEQNAIAVTEATRGAVFRDVLIARNRITNAHGTGIYVGPDKAGTPRGRFEDVTIIDNTVAGLVNRYAHAVYVRAADQRHLRMTISRNVLEAGVAQEANGIRTDDTFGGGLNQFADVLVTANTLRGFSRGVWLSPVAAAFVSGNNVDGNRKYITDPASTDLCVQP